ncbi:MAG: hypothetical protein J3Q66DRAFT_396773 [Benniella sp.]|nr:MAG: hypothetical protein J3Q66DRAFT_396773 [Benniella sp.]
MKFTSVILALSAVVAMVQAAPLPDVPLGPGGVDVDGVLPPQVSGLPCIPVGLPIPPPAVPGVPALPPCAADGDSTLSNLPGTGIVKRDLTKAIPADISTIQNTIHTVADQVQIDLENLVTVEVNAYIQAHLHVANIVSIDAEVLVAIRAVIRAAIGDIYPGLDATIDGLVNKAVTAADKVNVNELVPEVISLIHDLITKVVVAVDVEVLAKVYAEVKVLDIVEIPVAVDVHAKLGLNVEAVVGQLLANLPVADNLVKDLVQ